MPAWVRRQIDEFEAELVAARARCEKLERRDRILQAQIVKEAEVQQDLKRERDDARDEVAALKGTIEKLTQARADATAKQTDAQKALKWERDSALDEVAALKGTVEELTRARADAEARAVELSRHLRKVRQSKAQETARSIGAAFSPLVIAAAVATVGFWTYQLIWPAPQPLPAVISDSTMAAEREQAAIREEQLRQAAADTQAKLGAAEAEQQRLKEEVQRQAKATTDAETRLQAAQAEQQRQARAATDADGKRRAAEAEQGRLKEDLQRQTKAAAEVETKLKLGGQVANSV